MARDYARGKRSNTPRKTTSRRPAASRGSTAAARPRVWRWYGAGVITGLGASLALFLVTLPPGPAEPGDTPAPKASAEPAVKTPPKPRFDFYTMLPEQKIDVEVDPAEVAQPRTSPTSSSKEIYLLQAGSFRQREDADRRRAELLLLGLEPRVEASTSDSGRWFRVFIGPFDTHSKMAKARSLTAGQDIDTLLLKREG